MNLSLHSDETTARTRPACAAARAENLAALGVSSVIELCVGPSLRTLQAAYAKHNIRCTGNDITRRWKNYFPDGDWLLGDALAVDISPFDAAVFAPPVSLGCSGRRE